MEPIVDQPAVAEATMQRVPRRLTAALAALAIAGALTIWGAANVFAATPSPSASNHASTGTTHNCPAHSTSTQSN
jgi:hypothetical protein